jgi:hypothetical protein
MKPQIHCTFCQQDCTKEYYTWSYDKLLLERNQPVQKKCLNICPHCYNVPLEPNGTFGQNMIERGQGRIEKHTGNKIEVIREK